MGWSNEWGEPKLPLLEGQEREDFINKIPKITNIKLGNKTIPVIVVGDLGLDFCEPGEKDSGWNIYHLPTLACFSSGVPAIPCDYCGNGVHTGLPSNACENCMNTGVRKSDEYSYDKQPLLNWMAKVQESYPTSWQTLRQLTADTYRDGGEKAKEIIQKWCLSVPVV